MQANTTTRLDPPLILLYAKNAMKFSLRLLYLYLFSAIGLFITVIGVIRLVDLGLKVYVFHNADLYTFVRPVTPLEGQPSPSYNVQQLAQMEQDQLTEQKRNREREVASSLAMILVGSPVYLYHWLLIQKKSRR